MRILMLSQWFDPEPSLKGLIFAKQLAKRGATVEVLTGFPNYPGGKLYPGYCLRPWRVEWMDGFRVCRVPLYPSHDRSAVRRILNYVTFAVTSAVLGPALVHRPDVIYVYHPPGTIGLPALVLRRWFSVPIVYDMQDLWPDTVSAVGMLNSRLALGLLGRWCRFVYSRADRMVVPSPGFKSALVKRGVPTEKIEVIYNWFDEESITVDGGPVAPLTTAGRFLVLFAGTMGYAQDLETVLRAAEMCRERVPAAEFVFVGGGVDRSRLEHTALKMRLDNVRFLPMQPVRAMGRILASADVLLVHLKDDPLFRITIPSKTQAYLAAGKPILMAVRGDAAELVTRSGAGVVCEPGNPASIAEAVRGLAEVGPKRLAEMGENGQRYYYQNMSFRSGVGRFEAVFQAAAARRAAAEHDPESDDRAHVSPNPK